MSLEGRPGDEFFAIIPYRDPQIKSNHNIAMNLPYRILEQDLLHPGFPEALWSVMRGFIFGTKIYRQAHGFQLKVQRNMQGLICLKS